MWKGGSDLPGMPPLPLDPLDPVDPVDPLDEPPLLFRVSILNGGREGFEPYPSEPWRPPFKIDTLKSRGFVYAKRLFSKKIVVSSTRGAHF